MNKFKELVNPTKTPHGKPRLFTGMPLYRDGNDRGWYIVIYPTSQRKAVSFKDFLGGHQIAVKNCDSYFVQKYSIWKTPGDDIEMTYTDKSDWCNALAILRKTNPLYRQVADTHYGYVLKNGVWEKNNGWYEGGLPIPDDLVDLVFDSRSSQVSQLTLKQQNTDGRLNCAQCNGKIKVLKGFDISYNHCPVCEP